METRDTLWRAGPYFTLPHVLEVWEQFCVTCFTEFWWVDKMLAQTVAATGTHRTHTGPWLSPLSYREAKVRDRSKNDIQSGKASKKLPMISSSWAQWALSNTVNNSIHFPRHVRAAGRFSCIKLLKSCLHLVPCCSAAQSQEVHFLSMASVLAGEGRQHHNIHRCSCCKACVQRAECTKREMPFCALFWELGATLTAAQWEESKQDQIGQLDAEVNGKSQLQIFCRA